MNHNLTENQFKNLVSFIAVIMNEDIRHLLSMSPDYMTEKYIRYIGPIENIKDTVDHHSGVHAVLINNFLEGYFEIWGECFKD